MISRCSPFALCEDEPATVFDGMDESFWSVLTSNSAWLLSQQPISDQPKSLADRALGGFHLDLMGIGEPTNNIGLAAKWAMRLALTIFTLIVAVCTYKYVLTYVEVQKRPTATRGGQNSAWACSRCRENVYQSYLHRFKTWLVHDANPPQVFDDLPSYLYDRFVPYRPKARQTLRK